jgi:hypothetical protein
LERPLGKRTAPRRSSTAVVVVVVSSGLARAWERQIVCVLSLVLFLPYRVLGAKVRSFPSLGSNILSVVPRGGELQAPESKKVSEVEERSILNTSGSIPLYLRKASADLDWKLRFRIIAAKASRNNKNPRVYSRSESCIRDELVRMGYVEGESFFHQHRILGYLGKRGQRVYYWLDLFIPSLLLDIEADGEIWHHFFDMKARDRRRDSILKREYGIKVVRLSSHHLCKKRLSKVLARGISTRARALELAQACEEK